MTHTGGWTQTLLPSQTGTRVRKMMHFWCLVGPSLKELRYLVGQFQSLLGLRLRLKSSRPIVTISKHSSLDLPKPPYHDWPLAQGTNSQAALKTMWIWVQKTTSTPEPKTYVAQEQIHNTFKMNAICSHTEVKWTLAPLSLSAASSSSPGPALCLYQHEPPFLQSSSSWDIKKGRKMHACSIDSCSGFCLSNNNGKSAYLGDGWKKAGCHCQISCFPQAPLFHLTDEKCRTTENANKLRTSRNNNLNRK